MAVFWKNHLKDVDFSENTLREVPLGLFQLDVSLAALQFSFSAFVRKSLRTAGKPLCAWDSKSKRNAHLLNTCIVISKDWEAVYKMETAM